MPVLFPRQDCCWSCICCGGGAGAAGARKRGQATPGPAGPRSRPQNTLRAGLPRRSVPPGDSAALGQALSDPPSEPPRAQGTANTRAGVSTEPPIRPRCPCPAVPGGPDAGTAEGGAARPQDADTCFGALSSLWGPCLLDTLAQRQAELPAQRPSPVMHPTPPPRAPHLPEAPPPATPMSFLRR